MKNRNRPWNILIVAYAYEPNKTSEPGVGWHFTHEIAKFCNVTVLTRANNKRAIEDAKDSSNISYIYYDLPKFLMKLKKRIPFGIQIYFTLWQSYAYRLLKKTTKTEKFDLIHHLTFGTTKNVPPAYKLNLPFIWGPIGGGDFIPYIFLKKMGLKAHISEFFYRLLHTLSNISLWSYLTRKKADAIIFRISSIIEKFPSNGCQDRYLISESAMPSIDFGIKNKKMSEELRALCVGRIMHGKGYSYALKGFHDFILAGGKGKLIFLGRGPEEEHLKAYVNRHRLADNVEFKGFVSNEQVKVEMRKSHILLHPSFREGGSWSIMEAMSFGLPVICLNTSGPKDMVTDKCGLLIDMKSSRQVSEDIGKGLLNLFANDKQYEEMSKNAINRIVSEYNWNRRREQIKEVYDSILNREIST